MNLRKHHRLTPKRLLFASVLILLFSQAIIACFPAVDNCIDSSDCKRSEECSSYRCLPLDACNTDKDCRAPRSCIDSFCRHPKQGCSFDKDCPKGQICRNTKCEKPKPQGCKSDKDCTSPRFCKNGQCTEPIGTRRCKSDSDCKQGENCRLQKCYPENHCSELLLCPKGKICIVDTCKPEPITCSAQKSCPSGQKCESGKCVKIQPKCKENKDCQSGQTCQISTGKCIEIQPQCKMTKDCPSGQTCQISTGKCIDYADCSSQKPCPSGKSCLNGKCVKKGTCKTNQDCKHAEFCDVGKCVPIPLPGKGDWQIVVKDLDGHSFTGGCFRSNFHFEVSSYGWIVRYAGVSRSYGNLMVTTGTGSKWQCQNCTLQSGAQRPGSYQLVDMNIRHMLCGKGQAYAYGSFADNNPKPPATLYTKGQKGNWTPVKGVLGVNIGLTESNLFYTGTHWLVSILSNVYEIQEKAPNHLEINENNKRFYWKNSSKGSNTITRISSSAGIVFLEGYKWNFNGSKDIYPMVRYNVNNGTIPKGTKPEETPKYWPELSLPCGKDCSVLSILALDKQNFVLLTRTLMQPGMGTKLSSSKGFNLWHTKNGGKNWAIGYSKMITSGYIGAITGQILQVKGNKVLAVVGGKKEMKPASIGGSVGSLLESDNGGITFKNVTLSALRGDKNGLSRIPSLHSLHKSPNGELIYALGAGVVLQWALIP